jgi:hypothetical protein
LPSPPPPQRRAPSKQDAHEFGCTPFNAGTTIKVRSDAAHRDANLAKRIISEVEVSLPICAASSRRDSRAVGGRLRQRPARLRKRSPDWSDGPTCCRVTSGGTVQLSIARAGCRGRRRAAAEDARARHYRHRERRSGRVARHTERLLNPGVFLLMKNRNERTAQRQGGFARFRNHSRI